MVVEQAGVVQVRVAVVVVEQAGAVQAQVAADELELWGTSDDEQLMCHAVDEYERHNQVGHGQPEPAQPPPQPQPAQPSLLNHHNSNPNLHNPSLLNNHKLLSTTRLHLRRSFQPTTGTCSLLFVNWNTKCKKS